MSKAGKADSRAAKAAVYAANGSGECPYEAGSRLERYWLSWRAHYWNMESLFDEMATVYAEFRTPTPSTDGGA